MPRRQAPLQINQFTGGLNTEFNPLEVEPNTTSDEVNMEMERDGSRAKRLGFVYESNFELVNSGVVEQTSKNPSRQIYKWDNAGGDAAKYLYAVQVANSLHIFDPDSEDSISAGLIYSETFDSTSYDRDMGLTTIDGVLVVCTGQKEIKSYEYDGSTITTSTTTLKVRDLFGVQAINVTTPDDLTQQDNLALRPTNLSNEHVYNLRNQTFAYPRRANNTESQADPISSFRSSSGNHYPSNSDSINPFFYPDPNDSDNRLIDRYFSSNAVVNPPGVDRAPMGFFIIDALERGASRLEKITNLQSTYGALNHSVTSLPTDKTPGGAKVIAQFAGRIWYGGFSANIEDGDSKSPRMSSYLLFSRLVKDASEIGDCYQKADPTDPVDPEVVDTDGGFLRIDGAYGIKKLIPIDNSLFVITENGVWRVVGSEEGAFSAVSYQVIKLTDRGCISGGSVTQVDNTLLYWGRDAIYLVARNELGVWDIQDITKGKIQLYYSQLRTTEKEKSSGYFDSFERKVRWVCSCKVGEVDHSKELILNVDFGAFTKNETPILSNNLPLIVSIGETNPYSITSLEETVTADSIIVTADSEDVVVTLTSTLNSLKEVIYLVISGLSPTITFSFGTYASTGFYDWGGSVTGVSYDAYLVAGSVTGGEARFKKQTPYLNTFFRKTETGFESDLSPTRPSSCLLSSQWNWTNGVQSKKWSTPRQAYRIGRLYFPENSLDDYDSGDTIISTRNKIRGIGHSVAFRFTSEPGKDLHIYGWSFDLQANADE